MGKFSDIKGHWIFGLLIVLLVMGGCNSEQSASQEEIDKAIEAISVESEVQYKEQETQQELEHLNEDETEAYKKAEEAEKEKREATIAASPYLEYAGDNQAIIDFLENELDDAVGNCTKINAFMDLWNKSMSDPIFIAFRKDKQFKKPLAAVYKKAVGLKGNCKNP